MRVIITGSRDWPDRHAVWDALDALYLEHGHIELVHGGCPSGADAAADDWCRFRKVTPEVFRAKWDLYGRWAGPFRNQQMIGAGADVVLAFVRNDSAGTMDTITRAVRAGIKVVRKEMNDVRR